MVGASTRKCGALTLLAGEDLTKRCVLYSDGILHLLPSWAGCRHWLSKNSASKVNDGSMKRLFFVISTKLECYSSFAAIFFVWL